MDTHLVGPIVTLLLIACAVAVLTELIKIPYTIALVFVGLGAALSHLTPGLVITHDVTFTLILPPLLFQGALNMDLERLKREWKSIFVLAIPGVVVSTLFIGFLLHRVWAMEWLYAFLFGALITPTDPISVLSILKKAGAPERLRTILEGESLFNDGTGVVVFSVLLGMITGHESFRLATSAWAFVAVAGGSALLGAALGYAAFRVLKRIDDHLVEVTLSVVLAFGAPLLAEHIHLSGIITVVVAGLIVGNYGRILSMSRKTVEAVETFWEVVDFIVNSLLFLAIGLELQVVSPGELGHFWAPVSWGIAATLAARMFVVYPVVGVLNKITGAGIPPSWSHVLFWGGLKGSIPIALVVGLPPELRYRSLFLTAAFGIVLATLVFQGLTMKPLVKKLGLSASRP